MRMLVALEDAQQALAGAIASRMRTSASRRW